ncbi:hypothetical protein JCM13304A_14490 [Desulfothermus okinawensis JCM 13304]
MDKLKSFLLNYFSKQFLITKEAIDFFESNYGISHTKDLQKLLQNEPHLLKLIVYPDNKFKENFYTIAPPYVSRKTIKEYSRYLKHNIKQLQLNICREIITIYPPEKFFIDLFLGIKWHVEIPDKILKTLFELRQPSTEIIYKMKNTNISWNDNVISFFEMFFLKFKSREDLKELIDLILNFFNRDVTILDIKKFLIKRLTHIRQYLSSAISTSDKINKMGLEFVLMSKTPVLDVNRDKFEREAKLLQDILYNLFPDHTL